MGGTKEQWQRTLRRAYDIPDVVSDGVAMESLYEHLIVDHFPENQPGVNVPQLTRAIAEEVFRGAADGNLDEELLPDALRTSIRHSDAHTTPAQLIADRVLDRRAEWLETPSGRERIAFLPVVHLMIDRLRSYLGSSPLAYSTPADPPPPAD